MIDRTGATIDDHEEGDEEISEKVAKDTIPDSDAVGQECASAQPVGNRSNSREPEYCSTSVNIQKRERSNGLTESGEIPSSSLQWNGQKIIIFKRSLSAF